MSHSLRAKLSGLHYKGILEDKDYKRLCHALDLEKAEQEPCEDCVSRQEIIEHYTTGEMANVHHIDKNHLLAFVEQLSPVIPQEQTGHWIMNRQLERRTCDNCNTEYRWSFYPHNYCPNCGARMVEPTCDTCEYNTAAFMPCNACDNKSLFKPQESEDKI